MPNSTTTARSGKRAAEFAMPAPVTGPALQAKKARIIARANGTTQQLTGLANGQPASFLAYTIAADDHVDVYPEQTLAKIPYFRQAIASGLMRPGAPIRLDRNPQLLRYALDFAKGDERGALPPLHHRELWALRDEALFLGYSKLAAAVQDKLLVPILEQLTSAVQKRPNQQALTEAISSYQALRKKYAEVMQRQAPSNGTPQGCYSPTISFVPIFLDKFGGKLIHVSEELLRSLQTLPIFAESLTRALAQKTAYLVIPQGEAARLIIDSQRHNGWISSTLTAQQRCSAGAEFVKNGLWDLVFRFTSSNSEDSIISNPSLSQMLLFDNKEGNLATAKDIFMPYATRLRDAIALLPADKVTQFSRYLLRQLYIPNAASARNWFGKMAYLLIETPICPHLQGPYLTLVLAFTLKLGVQTGDLQAMSNLLQAAFARIPQGAQRMKMYKNLCAILKEAQPATTSSNAAPSPDYAAALLTSLSPADRIRVRLQQNLARLGPGPIDIERAQQAALAAVDLTSPGELSAAAAEILVAEDDEPQLRSGLEYLRQAIAQRLQAALPSNVG